MPVPDEMDSFAEFSSDKFRNLDEVDEFHDKTAEFPMDIETDSAVLGGAALDAADIAGKEETEGAEVSEGSKETEEEKREKERSNKATKEFIKNATNISSAQALAPVAVALVVTSAVVIPFIENVDVEVNLNMEFVAGILSYSIEIINASENETYEAFVYEGTSVIKETVIENGQLTDSIGGLPPYREHRVEVRSGSPALYVLSTSTIPAAPSWAEWGHLTVGFDVIDYGVYYHGISGEATLTLTDPYDEEVLYTKTLDEGLNSDIITGLRSSHQYTLTVASDTTIYLIEEVETEYSDVEWDHLTVIDNTIDYGVISDYSIENLTISLYDPDTSSVVYTKELLQGYDSDTIVELQFGHTYELTVATEEEIYLSEVIVTDSEPVTVTVDHITPENNTINYEITVSGEGKVLTLSLYNAAGGPPVFTTTIKSGTNSRVIEGLQYNHSYLLTVTSSTKSYVSENVTTEKEPTKVTLDHLKATQTTIDYKVTVTGDRDVATAYLKDSTSGAVLYSKELKIGENSATIEKLEVNHTYLFTVSTKTETLISQNITTDPEQTEVVLNHVRVVDNTIDYEVKVTGTSDTVAAHLYDSEGKEIYTVPLSVGSNTGVIRDLEYGSTYNFVVSSETKKYAEAAVTVDPYPTEVILNELSSDDNTITYDVTVIGGSNTLTAYFYDDNGTELYSEILEEGTNTGEIKDLEYQQTYHFTVSSEEMIYINETIEVEKSIEVVVNKLVLGYSTVDYDITVTGNSDDLYAYLLMDIEEIYSKKLSEGSNVDTIERADCDKVYTFMVKSDTTGDIYVQEEVRSPIVINSMKGVRNTIEYDITVQGSEDAVLYFSDYESYRIPLKSGGVSNTGTFAGTQDEPLDWWLYYSYYIDIGEDEMYGGAVATEGHIRILEEASATGNVISFKLEVLGSIGSQLEISVEDEKETQSYYHSINEDPQTIDDSIGGDSTQGPIIRWGTEYVIRASILGETFRVGNVKTGDAVIENKLEWNGDKGGIDYSFEVKCSSAVLEITEDEVVRDTIDLTSGTISDCFTSAYLGATYVFIAYVGDDEVYRSDPVEVPFPIYFKVLAGGVNSLTYAINDDLSGDYNATLNIYLLDGQYQNDQFPIDLKENPEGVVKGITAGTYEVEVSYNNYYKRFGTVVIVDE